jgi:uncharacterized protein YjbI with pentapeptide repeats
LDDLTEHFFGHIYKADLRRLRRLSSVPEPIFMLSMLSMDRLGPFADLSTASVEKADLRAASVAKADLSGAHLRTWALFPLHKRT